MVSLFLEPTYKEFLNNELFREDSPLNRDDSLRPYRAMRAALTKEEIQVNTVDYFLQRKYLSDKNLFVSLGGTEYWRAIAKEHGISMEAFFLFEPPVANPRMYEELRTFAPHFRRIFSFSTGPGLERYASGIKLEKFDCPQPFDDVLEPYWSNRERRFLTAIFGNKKPHTDAAELYSERIRAVRFFARRNEIDLYGQNWDMVYPRHPFHFQWYFDRHFRRARRGKVASKYETLSRYDFALCYENSVLQGYVTEKIFDCLYAGSVPIYLGAPNITDFIPRPVFIDPREFRGYEELRLYLRNMNRGDMEEYREAGKSFLRSDKFYRFSTKRLGEIFLELVSSSCRQ